MSDTDNEQVKKEIEALLETLGGSADEVADHLENEDCTGIPSKPGSCPVAVLLRREFGDRVTGSIMARSDRIEVRTSPFGEPNISVMYPSGVRTFVAKFDSGRYPTLTPQEVECD